MGLSSSKTKTTRTSNSSSTPLDQYAPFINQALDQSKQVFQDQQPVLAGLGNSAQQAFNQLAPTAFGTSPYLASAQTQAQNIGNGQYLGNNPGASTYSSIQNSTNPALADYQNIINGNGAGNSSLSAFANGSYVNGQPSASLYSSIMDPSYLTNNPYLDQFIATTGNDVTKAANQRFAAAGQGAGVSSALADVLTKNLANSENTIRYQNYNDAANRQLTAAGQSDSAYNAARQLQLGAAQDQASNQLSATGGLGSTYNQQQQTQLGAASAADASRNTSIQQMLTALGLQPSLTAAQYDGVAPALSLLNASANLPYTGVNNYANLINGLTSKYGNQSSNSTQTETSTPSLMSSLMQGASLASSFLGGSGLLSGLGGLGSVGAAGAGNMGMDALGGLSLPGLNTTPNTNITGLF